MAPVDVEQEELHEERRYERRLFIQLHSNSTWYAECERHWWHQLVCPRDKKRRNIRPN